MEGPRRPAVAGQFYPEGPEALRRAIAECYRHPLGPGALPRVRRQAYQGVAGLVVPHAGYVYSGPVAAHCYAWLASQGRPRRLVLLGPDHFGGGRGVSASPWSAWETPLGTVEVDVPLAGELEAQLPSLEGNPGAHAQEHSLEVQLPFLQHAFGPELRLLPISMTDQTEGTARELGAALARLLEREDGGVILATTDLSHYVPDETARRRDRRVLDSIEALDASGIWAALREGVNMCGPGPVMAMLTALRLLGCREARVLCYATSGDTSGDRGWVVGYVAAVAEAPGVG